jgi:hypothetical protein
VVQEDTSRAVAMAATRAINVFMKATVPDTPPGYPKWFGRRTTRRHT